MDVPGGRKESAVLVPLFADASGATHVVFTERRHDLRRHAGEISFPGGRRDGDETLLRTALREAWEEIGLPSEAVEIAGALAPVGTYVTNYKIYPFVGVIEAGLEWVIAETEVAQVLELSSGHADRRRRRAPDGPPRDGVQDAHLRGRRAPHLGRHGTHPRRPVGTARARVGG